MGEVAGLYDTAPVSEADRRRFLRSLLDSGPVDRHRYAIHESHAAENGGHDARVLSFGFIEACPCRNIAVIEAGASATISGDGRLLQTAMELPGFANGDVSAAHMHAAGITASDALAYARRNAFDLALVWSEPDASTSALATEREIQEIAARCVAIVVYYQNLAHGRGADAQIVAEIREAGNWARQLGSSPVQIESHLLPEVGRELVSRYGIKLGMRLSGLVTLGFGGSHVKSVG